MTTPISASDLILCFGDDRVIVRDAQLAAAILEESQVPPADDSWSLDDVYSQRNEDLAESIQQLRQEQSGLQSWPSLPRGAAQDALHRGIPRLPQPPLALALWKQVIGLELPSALAFKRNGRIELQASVTRVELVRQEYCPQLYPVPYLTFALTGYRLHSNGTFIGVVRSKPLWSLMFSDCHVRGLDGHWTPWGVEGALTKEKDPYEFYDIRYYELDDAGRLTLSGQVLRESQP